MQTNTSAQPESAPPISPARHASSGEAASSRSAAQRPDNPQPSTLNPQPRPAGRPTLLTEKTLTALRTLIQDYGMSDTAAAKAAGIGASTLSRWKTDYEWLANTLAAAREDFRMDQLHLIKTAHTRDGRPDWRAAAWLLKHVFPEDYNHRAGRTAAESSFQAPDPAEVDARLEPEFRAPEPPISTLQQPPPTAPVLHATCDPQGASTTSAPQATRLQTPAAPAAPFPTLAPNATTANPFQNFRNSPAPSPKAAPLAGSILQATADDAGYGTSPRLHPHSRL